MRNRKELCLAKAVYEFASYLRTGAEGLHLGVIVVHPFANQNATAAACERRPFLSAISSACLRRHFHFEAFFQLLYAVAASPVVLSQRAHDAAVDRSQAVSA